MSAVTMQAPAAAVQRSEGVWRTAWRRFKGDRVGMVSLWIVGAFLLLVALAHIQDPDAYVVCNGYKDAEFIDLALAGLKIGIQTLIVLEMPAELDLVLERLRHELDPG